MRKTTLALAAATLLGGLALGAGAASAHAAAGPAGLRAGTAPTTYVMMMKKKMMKKKPMMNKKMMMKKKMM